MKVKELKHASEYVPKCAPPENEQEYFGRIVEIIESASDAGFSRCSIKISILFEDYVVSKLIEKGFNTSVRYNINGEGLLTIKW